MTATKIHTNLSLIEAGGIASRLIGAGEAWRLSEHVCTSGPGDRSFEERHEHVSIAAVVEGTFNYHGHTGRVVLHPGALLLGNSGSCYACGHDHGRGDRCISLNVAPDLFAEVAASTAGSSRFAFPVARLPETTGMLPWLVKIEIGAARLHPLRMDEMVPAFVAVVIETVSQRRLSSVRTSARDEKRIREVVRHIETHADQSLDLGALAGLAGMSRFHFLRVFRRVVGLTPYQFLLNMRMRRAALKLATTRQSIAGIAYDSGFGDLSTFNNRFRANFGIHPRGFRAREGLSRAEICDP